MVLNGFDMALKESAQIHPPQQQIDRTKNKRMSNTYLSDPEWDNHLNEQHINTVSEVNSGKSPRSS